MRNKTYVLDALDGRVATWRRDTLLFIPEEVEEWKQNGYKAVLLLSQQGNTGFVVHLNEIKPLTSRYHYATWLKRPRIDFTNLGFSKEVLNVAKRSVSIHEKERYVTSR